MELQLKEMRVWRENIATETRAIEARTAAMWEMMNTSHKEMVAESKPEMDAETMACQEMEACLEEKSRPQWTGYLRWQNKEKSPLKMP
jgi:hypothetical protein